MSVSLWREFLRMLYPDRCGLCGVIGCASPCPSCQSEMERTATPFVTDLGEPYDYHLTIFRYHGRAAQAVRALKYHRKTSLVEWMASEMRDAYNEFSIDVDAIVPVPIHWRREAERGFNQAELLCEKLPSHLVARHDLLRVRATKTQVGLSIEERLNNLIGAFSASESSALIGKDVLLVDDVMTSGQTARTCAAALKEAGAQKVGVLAFAGNPSEERGVSVDELT